ncbi:MAG TPA: hypothetical protein VID31_04970 [Streptosporangiaceae bacterium]|jgi:hypothetical protein
MTSPLITVVAAAIVEQSRLAWTTGADGYRPLLAPAVRDQVIPHLRASGRLAWPG